jgi:hypothetical protein
MNRKVLLTFLFIILCVSFLVVYSQIKGSEPIGDGSETSNPPQEPCQTYDVKITDFKWTSSQWGSPGGVSAAVGFNITIQNQNDLEINRLNVTLKMFDANGGELDTETWFYGPGEIGWGALDGPFDGILHGNETRTLRGYIKTDWGTLATAWDLGPATTIAYVTLDSVVLDELEVNF